MVRSDRKTNVVVIVLAVLLIISLGYIGYNFFVGWKMSAFDQGTQIGYQQAILQVAQSAVTCKPVPLTVGNATINLIAVECLQQQATQQQEQKTPEEV